MERQTRFPLRQAARRFNYQQRVGRTGRRDAPLSAALTVCRGRTHDDFYFQSAERITSDPPPQPYLDLERFEIVRRVLNAEALRRAFQDHLDGITEAGGANVHGQFGNVSDWPARMLRSVRRTQDGPPPVTG